jgi:ketosteroid isomerase-like protein
MPKENVEIVREVYDAFNRRDWDAAFRTSHPDIELTTQRGPNAGTRRGRKPVQEFIEDYIAAFDNLIWEPDEFFDSGKQVVVFVNVRSRPKGGNVDMEVRNGHLWTIRDGTILSIKTFPAREEALEAAGLRE